MVAGVTSTVFFNEIQYSNNGDPDTGDFIKIGPIAQIPGAQNTGQTLILSTSATPDIVINEVLFDPENDPASAGDANGDGTRSASQDEFIEILNTTGGDIDISGWTLSDDDGDDFTFPSGSVLGAGQAAVLFGGGSPAGNVGDGNPNTNFGGALVFVDDGTIGNGLSNTGDLIELRDDSGTLIDSVGYGNAGSVTGGSDQSITRDPDGTGSFADHSTATGSGGALFSPGTQIDGSAFAAPVEILFEESFETDGNGSRYTTSITEASDGFGDYFTRTDGSTIGSFVELTGKTGDFFFAAQDTNADPGADVATLTFSGIDISGQSELFFSIDVAEDQASNDDEDWDSDTALIIEYSIDGGAFQNLLAFEATNETGFNSEPRQDTDFDGIGDGPALTPDFQTFSAALTGTGSSLDIRITFNALDDGDEDVAIDNLILSNGELTPPPPPPTFSIADAEVIEGDAGEGTISFDITLSEPAPVGGASVDFSTTDGTATSPGDFDALTDFTVEFAEGETQKTVSLAVFGDTDFEPDETFTATLSNPTGTGAVIGDGEATGTILNDDAPPPQAPAEVFINEIHYDNSSTDVGEAVEIAGPAGTDLSGWTLVLYNGNGGVTYSTIALSGTIDDEGSGFGALSFDTPGIQNGPDGIALVDAGGAVVQFLSYEGSFVATNGPAVGLTSEDIGVSESGTPVGTSLQLKGTGFVYDDFDWAFPGDDSFGDVNEGQSFVAAPAAGSLIIDEAQVSEGDSGTTAMTFSVFRVGGSAGAVSVDYSVVLGGDIPADGDDLSGALSGTVNFADGETSQTITVDVVGDTDGEPTESFEVSLSNATGGAAIGDGRGIGTIVNDDDLNLTISQIQGAGHTSIFVDNEVTTGGIVTAVAGNGFYLQSADADADGDAATSEGIFVFTGSAPTVSVGDDIDVTGTVGEFLPGGDPANLTITQLTSPAITVLSSGNPLPTAVVIGPNGVTPPTEIVDDDGFSSFDPANDGIDFYESLEGMLVTIENPVAVDSTNGFGELFTVASDGEGGLLATNVSDEGLVVIDGADVGTFGTFNADGGSDFNPERIQIDESGEINGQIFAIPDANPGDVLNDVTGVVTYGFENYEVRPTSAVTIAQTSTNVAETTTLVQGAVGQLSVATYNVLNLDINPNDGDDDVANGLGAKVLTDIAFNLDTPDIVVLQEIQDDSGSVDDGTTSAQVTLEALAAEIFALTGVQYEVLDNPFVVDGETGGQPGGNIRVAMLYNPDRVTLDEASVFTITEPGDTELNSAFSNSRAPLGAEFTFNGEKVTVIGNHFTSKIGSDSTFSANQPPFNAGALTRAAQAAAVNEYVDDLVEADPDAHVIVVGDFNEFQFEEPMEILTGELDFDGTTVSEGSDVVLENLTNNLAPEDRFSVLFQGNAQALDHILATEDLASDAQIDAVHTNTPLGGVGSDHDPMLAVFSIGVQVQIGTFLAEVIDGTDREDFIDAGGRNDVVNGNDGDDDLNGGFGSDILNGGEGDDTLNGDDGNDTLNGDDGNDTLNGGNQNDILNGGTGNDILNGGVGVDRLDGGAGMDTLTGGNNRDIFVLDAGGTSADADTVTDFNPSNDDVEINNAGGKVILVTQDGGDVVMTADGVLFATFLNATVEDVLGHTDTDAPAFIVTNAVIGTRNAETLDGTDDQADLIDASGRNDVLNGLGGDDVMFGGFGSDELNGGDGADFMNGECGNDILNGGVGDDILNGGNQNDILNGEAGDDVLNGDEGVDVLNGGAGLDTLTGGAQRDTFVLDAGGTAPDADTVTDFNIAQDDIEFQNAGGKAFVFEQVAGDVTATADGVLIATFLNADVADVIGNATYDAAPASVEDGTPAPVSMGASVMTTQVLAEDALFEFAETPMEDMAPLNFKVAAVMPSTMSLDAIFVQEGLVGPGGDEENPINPLEDPWMVYNTMGMENII